MSYLYHKGSSSGSISSSSGSINGIIGSSAPNTEVKKDKLKAVAGDRWKINNLWDSTRRPRDAKVIVEEALKLVGTKPKYNLLSNNCEHFATELRYGVGKSEQVSLPGV